MGRKKKGMFYHSPKIPDWQIDNPLRRAFDFYAYSTLFFFKLFHSYSLGYSFSHRRDSLQTLQETVGETLCYYYNYILVVSIERNVWQDIFAHNRKDRAVFTSVTYYILLYRHECFYMKITYSLSRFLRLVNTLLGRVWMAGECVKYLSKVIVKQGIRYFLK